MKEYVLCFPDEDMLFVAIPLGSADAVREYAGDAEAASDWLKRLSRSEGVPEAARRTINAFRMDDLGPVMFAAGRLVYGCAFDYAGDLEFTGKPFDTEAEVQVLEKDELNAGLDGKLDFSCEVEQMLSPDGMIRLQTVCRDEDGCERHVGASIEVEKFCGLLRGIAERMDMDVAAREECGPRP